MLRISDLDKKPFSLEKLEKIKWKTGESVKESDIISSKNVSNKQPVGLEALD